MGSKSKKMRLLIIKNRNTFKIFRNIYFYIKYVLK